VCAAPEGFPTLCPPTRVVRRMLMDAIISIIACWTVLSMLQSRYGQPVSRVLLKGLFRPFRASLVSLLSSFPPPSILLTLPPPISAPSLVRSDRQCCQSVSLWTVLNVPPREEKTEKKIGYLGAPTHPAHMPHTSRPQHRNSQSADGEIDAKTECLDMTPAAALMSPAISGRKYPNAHVFYPKGLPGL